MVAMQRLTTRIRTHAREHARTHARPHARTPERKASIPLTTLANVDHVANERIPKERLALFLSLSRGPLYPSFIPL